MHARPAEDSTDALIRADRLDREVVADLVGDPLVGAWIMRTVRQMADGDLAQFGALAAAAAIRTGQDARLASCALDGRVTFPTLGTALTGMDGPVVIDVSRGSAIISGSSGSVCLADDDPGWLPLRRLSVRHGGVGATVALEDSNLFRNSYHAPPAARLGIDEVRHWQILFDGAWSLLVRYRPERAAELSVGLRSLVPLKFEDGDMARSGTARDSFGAMGLTTPRSAVDFAITLVHEFQHSKLSGLLDLVALTAPNGTERHFAPWREDPRPTAGLIQGTYAFLGIADTWRGLRAAPELAEHATREFAAVRCQVDVGLTALGQSAELTRNGRAFVAQLRVAADRLLAEPVPASVDREAKAALAACRMAWTERNRVSA